MGIYQHQLPQLGGEVCITDGGMETDLCFNHKVPLPEFAAYDLLRTEQGYSRLFDYYQSYVELAKRYEVALILETPTWRANSDWGAKLGDSLASLREFNLASVALVEHVRAECGREHLPIVISGCIGPRGDGYTPGQLMTAEEAQAYHSVQIATFAASAADMVSAMTLNYIDEAIGITRAALAVNMPVSISFTVETDGKLPTGESLADAIAAVDGATQGGPSYYMVNCAHYQHVEHLFQSGEAWLGRVKGMRGNASCLSHAELDEAEVLDDGNPSAFGRELCQLKGSSGALSVLGGCCGTDLRHIESLCRHLVGTTA